MGDLEEGFIGKKYVVDTVSKKTGKDTWNVLDVTVSKHANSQKERLGTYRRNYHNFYETFHPFMQGGREFALYSSDYMYTRVMDLPSCKDLGGENGKKIPYKDHFCPVEFYVPFYRTITFPKEGNEKELSDYLKGKECFEKEYDNGKNRLGPIEYCDFGFVAGCSWGDDSSWKIQFMDLSKVSEGIILRDERLGYLELPKSMNLKDAIDIDNWQPGHPWIGVTHTTHISYMAKKKRE